MYLELQTQCLLFAELRRLETYGSANSRLRMNMCYLHRLVGLGTYTHIICDTADRASPGRFLTV